MYYIHINVDNNLLQYFDQRLLYFIHLIVHNFYIIKRMATFENRHLLEKKEINDLRLL